MINTRYVQKLMIPNLKYDTSALRHFFQQVVELIYNFETPSLKRTGNAIL